MCNYEVLVCMLSHYIYYESHVLVYGCLFLGLTQIFAQLTYSIHKWTSIMLDNFHFIRCSRIATGYFICLCTLYILWIQYRQPDLETCFQEFIPITSLHVQVQCTYTSRCEWSLLLIDRDLETAQLSSAKEIRVCIWGRSSYCWMLVAKKRLDKDSL